MRNILLLNKEKRYQLALFGILVISSAISVCLFVMRAAPSKNGPFTSLVWNLILAWVPFGFAWIAYIAYTFTHLPKTLRAVLVGVCTVFWLTFFPNALYILTDFQHLAIRYTQTPIWYDVTMLLWFSWSGLFLGLTSLYFMQKVVTRWLGKFFSWVFVVGAIVLGSLGVYVGRFPGWNSWDLIMDPFNMSGKLLGYLSVTQERMLSFSIPIAPFFLFVYMTFFVFGRLINEPDKDE
jgi:uncharacterized membrane protein